VTGPWSRPSSANGRFPPHSARQWQAATDEPLLWLPDIAAGAAALAAIGDTAHWDDLAAAFSVEIFTLI